MRADQYLKLQQLEESLTDVLLTEVDSKTWPGAGIEPRAMDPQTRGDRYWCKKNAVATISLIQRIGTLVVLVQRRDDGLTPPAPDEEDGEPSLDAEVASAEKEAGRLLRDLQKRGRAPG